MTVRREMIGMGDDFKTVYARIISAVDVRTQAELAQILGIRQSSVSDAKRRGTIPADWFLTLMTKFRLNPDWVRYGEGSKFLRDDFAAVAESGAEFSDPLTTTVRAGVYGMNGGNGMDEAPLVGKISLPQAMVTDTVKVFVVDDDHAAPYVCRDAYIGVDAELSQPVPRLFFAVRMPGGGMAVRRLMQDVSSDAYILESGAGDAVEKISSADEVRQRLLGRVVWVLQKM